MPTQVKGSREMVEGKYIPTSDSYRNMNLQGSISSKDYPMETVTCLPGVWTKMSRAMALHLKAKQVRKKQGVEAPDGFDLANRMQGATDTSGQMRHEQINDFEFIIRGED